MKAQILVSAVVVVVAAALAGLSVGGPVGAAVGALLGLVVGVAFAWWSLREGRHTPWERAQAELAAGKAVAFWKPGCLYCERLLRRLGRDERVVWVNVWQDDGANSRVRELNDGNEYTPTVLVGDAVLRNPSADEVREALG